MKITLVLLLCLSFLISCQSVSSFSRKKQQEALEAWENGQKEDAISLMSEAIKHSPEFYDARIQLGNFHQESKNYSQAIDTFEKAIAKAPEKPAAFLGAGKTYLKMAKMKEDGDEAEKIYRKGQHNFSQVLDLQEINEDDRFHAVLGKGICLLERTLTEDSRRFLEQALKWQPDNLEVRFYNARLHEIGIGPNKKSLDQYNKILAKKPDHLDALLCMGDMFVKINNTENAIYYYQTFIDKGGASRRVKEWLSANVRKPVETEVSAVESVPVKKIAPPSRVKTCVECGRLAKQDDTVCPFDGGDLVIQDDPHVE
ncbi:MAG: tetratricopeptide repeat protein [Candidatus Brocadiae bacterium]|nr:tetratricopeptide repeat protein [Candidatus Brocadiia bacterium]